MENYPFDAEGLDRDIIDLFDDTYKALKSSFTISPTGFIDFQLEQFETFRTMDYLRPLGSFAVKQGNGKDFYVLFIEKRYHGTVGRGNSVMGDEYQTWMIGYLKTDFDRVLIRRETLTDKIIELVHPVELDFDDDKAFSDTFYVLVNDRNKALRGIDRNFRNAVMDLRHDEVIVEVLGHTVIVGQQAPLMPETAVHFAQCAERLCKWC